MINDDFINRLKQAGKSLTESRQTVFDILNLHGPLTMNELVSRSKNKVDRATVYRVIKLFEELDIVSRIPIGWKYKLELSEQFNSHHHHLTCLNCSKIIDVKPSESLEQDIAKLAEGYNFKIKNHRLEITGICKECQLKTLRSEEISSDL